ncbi:MAG: hypothetical protein ACTIDY_15795 [Halomonadaceae bacterium]|nr:hypothetical protein [Halomonas colorata]
MGRSLEDARGADSTAIPPADYLACWGGKTRGFLLNRLGVAQLL